MQNGLEPMEEFGGVLKSGFVFTLYAATAPYLLILLDM
jgi:hypothetical protein